MVEARNNDNIILVVFDVNFKRSEKHYDIF